MTIMELQEQKKAEITDEVRHYQILNNIPGPCSYCNATPTELKFQPVSQSVNSS